MAFFGFNLTVSIVGLFFLRKLIPAFDFPSKLLTGFYRFYAPSENDCRQAAQLKPKTVKASKKNQNVQSKEFVIPKDAEVPLYFAQVKADDWSFLHFYPEFCWLVEFSITTLFVLAVTEAVPSDFKWRGDSVPDELNLSVIWIILACLFCSINLARLSSKLIRSTGERSLLVMFGTFTFVSSLSALTLSSEWIELGFQELVSNLERMSKLGLTLVICLFSAFFGSVFSFCGFRVAQMNRDAAENEKGIKKMLVHGSFFCGLLIPITFFPKLFRLRLQEPSNLENFEWLPGGFDDVLIDRIQLAIIICSSAWKLFMWRTHIQAYLAIAKTRVERARKMKKNYTQQEMSKNVTLIWYYTLVTTLQYILPTVLLMFLALLYKSASGMTWYGPQTKPWSNPSGLDKLPEGTFVVAIKYLLWLVSNAQALSMIGGYIFHSVIDTDL